MKKAKLLKIASSILLVSNVFPVKKYSCPDKQSLVVLTFDDGYRCWKTTILPILARYGLPATVFINDPDTARIPEGPQISWQDILELHHAGWEIGWHTAEHIKVTNVKRSKLVEDFSRSQVLFEAHDLPAPVTFAYPNGRHHSASMATTSRFYLAARTVHAGVNLPHYVQKNPADLLAVNLVDAIPFVRVKEVIEKWSNQGALIIIAAHTVGQVAHWQSKPDMDTEEFEKLAGYLYAGQKNCNFNVLTLKEGVQSMNNRQITSGWSLKPASPVAWHVTHGGFSIPQRCFTWYQNISRFIQHRWPKQ